MQLFKGYTRLQKLEKDLFLLFVGVVFAVVLIARGFINQLAVILNGWGLIGVFITGIGFSTG